MTFVMQDFNPLPGYPNAKRVSLMSWECQKCKDKKLDVDLHTKTGLCGACQSEEWRNKNYEECNKITHESVSSDGHRICPFCGERLK